LIREPVMVDLYHQVHPVLISMYLHDLCSLCASSIENIEAGKVRLVWFLCSSCVDLRLSECRMSFDVKHRL